MSSKRVRNIQNYDWISLSLYFALICIGWMMIYAASYDVDNKPAIFNLNGVVGKQTVWILLSFFVLFLTQLMDARFWKTLAYPIYILMLGLLVLVLIIGTTIKGATSWFSLGGFSLQPSEFAKLGACLALSSYLAYYKNKLQYARYQWTSAAIALGPALLILLQPDAGSALIFVSFFILLFRAGMPPMPYIIVGSFASLFIFSLAYGPFPAMICILWIFSLMIAFQLGVNWTLSLSGLLVVVLAGYFSAVAGLTLEVSIISFIILFFLLILLIFKKKNVRYIFYPILLIIAAGFSFGSSHAFNHILEPHQQDRINVWLKPELSDPHGALYNLLQSKMAIGSGGFQGKGFLKGTMSKLNYVPEQNTDFIFTVIGEEQGFIGSFGIIFLFGWLMYRIISVGEQSESLFTLNYAYGFAGILFFHFAINIGMTLGLFPIIGIPLPFISYGGSSLMGFTLLMGVYLKISSSRT